MLVLNTAKYYNFLLVIKWNLISKATDLKTKKNCFET